MKQWWFTVLVTGALFVTLQAAEKETIKNSTAKPVKNLMLEGGNGAILATRHRFYITYSDKVSGGCLPKPARLQDKLELAMRRNNLEISSKKEPAGDKLHLVRLASKRAAVTVPSV